MDARVWMDRPFRIHERRLARFSVVLVGENRSWRADATVENVSLGGACVAVPQVLLNGQPSFAIAPGSRFIFQFRVATLWDALNVPAVAVWTRLNHRPTRTTDPSTARRSLVPTLAMPDVIVGAKFESIAESDALALYDLIDGASF